MFKRIMIYGSLKLPSALADSRPLIECEQILMTVHKESRNFRSRLTESYRLLLLPRIVGFVHRIYLNLLKYLKRMDKSSRSDSQATSGMCSH